MDTADFETQDLVEQLTEAGRTIQISAVVFTQLL
jgi:hypothetical protein